MVTESQLNSLNTLLIADAVTTCNPTNGDRVTHTTNLSCTAPPRTDEDGDGYALEDSPADCQDSGTDAHLIYPGAPIRDCKWGSQTPSSQLTDDNCNGEPDQYEPGCDLSPIIIDVRDDGFDLTDAAGGVAFDLNSDGVRELLAWTRSGSDDAWLFLDRNGNATVDNGEELFGNFTPQPPSEEPNGFRALAEFDRLENGGNNDGLIDKQDAIFSFLRLWQDVNHNGISEPDELHPLPTLGIEALSLRYRESRLMDQHGNRFRYRARVYRVRGAQVGLWAWDVYLVRGK